MDNGEGHATQQRGPHLQEANDHERESSKPSASDQVRNSSPPSGSMSVTCYHLLRRNLSVAFSCLDTPLRTRPSSGPSLSCRSGTRRSRAAGWASSSPWGGPP